MDCEVVHETLRVLVGTWLADGGLAALLGNESSGYPSRIKQRGD
jgi:hypothetical protein